MDVWFYEAIGVNGAHIASRKTKNPEAVLYYYINLDGNYIPEGQLQCNNENASILRMRFKQGGEYYAGISFKKEGIYNISINDREYAVETKNLLYGIDIYKNKINLGVLKELITSDKSNLVSAINECFQNASDGKSKLAAAIGNGATASMTWDQLSRKTMRIDSYSSSSDKSGWVTFNIPKKYNNIVAMLAFSNSRSDRTIGIFVNGKGYIAIDGSGESYNGELSVNASTVSFKCYTSSAMGISSVSIYQIGYD